MTSPAPIGSLLARYSRVFQVLKRCACGAEWTGNSFLELRPDEPLPRPATCEACLEREEQQTKALYSRPLETIPDVELLRPKTTGEIT